MAADLDRRNRADMDGRPPEHRRRASASAGPLDREGLLATAGLWLVALVMALTAVLTVMGLAAARAVTAASGAALRWLRHHAPLAWESSARLLRGVGKAAAVATLVALAWWRAQWPGIRTWLASVGRHAAAGAVELARAGAASAAAAGAVAVHAARDRRGRRDAFRWVARLASCGVGVAVISAVVAVAGRQSVSGLAASVSVPAPERVVLPELAQRSEIFAADGSSLGVVHGDDANRVVVSLESLPQHLIHAVIDTEDAEFWDHGGVDVEGIARAAKRNVEAGEVRQGGSTITQQLAKLALLSSERNLQRKLSEVILAGRLEKQLGKRGVLERYLNTVYFGNGAYGVAAASESYFGRPVGELTVDQAALLAGLIRGPNLYDPFEEPERARQRRRTVLDLMVGHGHLAPVEAETADAAALPARVNRPPVSRGYVSDAVRAELLADPRLGPTPEAREKALQGGGLRIHTTFDPRLQQAAEAAVGQGLPRGTRITAALASVDPATGQVRAMVGGPDYGASQFNAALAGAGRQTGSAFKVFTLVAALEQGRSPNEQIDGNAPCPVPNPGGEPDPWLPDNYEGRTFGPLTIADAVAQSSNCAFARLGHQVGAENVALTAKKMGITAPLQRIPSITLGTNSVPPLQMASAFATLAAGGVAHPPHVIDRIDGPDGRVLVANDGAGSRAVGEQTALLATSMLAQVVERGTGQSAALPDRPAAGKTGTAQNHQDAWFVGYTPQLATAVWMGHAEGEKPMAGVQGVDVTGGGFPARIWSRFMTDAHRGVPPLAFPAPDPLLLPPTAGGSP